MVPMAAGALIGGGINAAMQYSSTGTVQWGGLGGVIDAAGDGATFGLLGMRAGNAPAAEGTVYLRTNPKTGEPYVGQAKSPERFDARQGEHDRALGVKHDYQILGNAKPGKDLNVLEESKIREAGGIQKNGGSLANQRHQMSEKNYRAAGGTVDSPTN